MKKKHILWVFLLTAIVATPPIYQRLSEAHRLKQIKIVKHEASQINAIPLNDFLGQLKDTSPLCRTYQNLKNLLAPIKT